MSDSTASNLCPGSGHPVRLVKVGGSMNLTVSKCSVCNTLIGTWATSAEIEVAGKVVHRATNHTPGRKRASAKGVE